MLIISNQTPEIQQRLKRQFKNLIKRGVVPLQSSDKKIHLSAIIDIQQLTNYDVKEIKKSFPKGLRLLLTDSSNEVLIALDFFYKKDKLFFMHALTGAPLENFVDMINKLEKRYKNQKETQKIICIEFLFTPAVYLGVINKNITQIYNYRGNRLQQMDISRLQNQLNTFKKSRKSLITKI